MNMHCVLWSLTISTRFRAMGMFILNELIMFHATMANICCGLFNCVCIDIFSSWLNKLIQSKWSMPISIAYFRVIYINLDAIQWNRNWLSELGMMQRIKSNIVFANHSHIKFIYKRFNFGIRGALRCAVSVIYILAYCTKIPKKIYGAWVWAYRDSILWFQEEKNTVFFSFHRTFWCLAANLLTFFGFGFICGWIVTPGSSWGEWDISDNFFFADREDWWFYQISSMPKNFAVGLRFWGLLAWFCTMFHCVHLWMMKCWYQHKSCDLSTCHLLITLENRRARLTESFRNSITTLLTQIFTLTNYIETWKHSYRYHSKPIISQAQSL